MNAATLVPAANSPPGQDLTTPTHSMPLTSAISAHSPLRMCSSAWLRPNAFTSITAWPAFGSGSGTSRMTSTSGPPNPVLRIARMSNPPLEFSLSTQPPGDVKGFTRNPGGFGAGQEPHHGGDVLRPAGPAERGFRFHLLFEIAAGDAGGVQPLGFDDSGVDGVDADFARPQLLGQGARDRIHGRLGGAV